MTSKNVETALAVLGHSKVVGPGISRLVTTNSSFRRAATSEGRRGALRLGAVALLILALAVLPARPAAAQGVGLGTADNFAVLAGQGVTNTGPTTINGDLGTWPNPAVTGAGLTVNGSIHTADAVARQAQADTTIAYNDAAGRPGATEVATELGGQTLTAGVYDSAASTFQITGTVTLNAQGDPDAVFIFQAASTLISASNSDVALINGADACNVFWQVGGSATLGTNSTFQGTILALESITVTTGATIDGHALARNGSVTLDTNTISRPTCAPPETTGIIVTSSPNPSVVGEPVTYTATVTPVPDGGTVAFKDGTTTIAGCGSQAVDTSTGQATCQVTYTDPGTHSVTAHYTGSSGFGPSTSSAVDQDIAYAVELLYDPTKPNKGSTIRVELQLVDATGNNLSASNITVTATGLSPSPAPGTAPTGAFTFQTTKQGPAYQLSVKARKYPAGTYTLSFTAGADPTTHTAQFVVS